MAIDFACGYGRHAVVLADRGYRVLAIDLDGAALRAISRRQDEQPGERAPILPVRADLSLGIPLMAGKSGVVIAIHPPSTVMLSNISSILAPGGYLVLETFGAQGGNWVGLPPADEVRRLLTPHFDLLMYKERPAGPAGRDAVSVKVLAKLKDRDAHAS